MSVRVSGKHMEIGDSFRQRIEDQIGMAVTKYFDGGYSGQVTVHKSSSRFAADCKLHLDSGVVSACRRRSHGSRNWRSMPHRSVSKSGFAAINAS